MKKLLAVVLLFCAAGVKADSTVSDQFKAALVNDMAAVYGHTSHNEDKVYFLTSLIQLGHFKNDYIVGFDFGAVGSNNSGHLSYGIHGHLVPFLIAYIPMNPDLAGFLSHIEISPRYSYDEDVHHGVLSYIAGAKISY